MPDDTKSESLRIKGISKRYPGVVALDGVDLVLRKGEIHGMVGKNGAGKSTAVKIIYGVTNADAGTMEITSGAGRQNMDTVLHNPARARAMGIYMVPQEPVFALDLTIEENFFMAQPIMKSFFAMNRKEMQKRAVESMRNFKLPFSPTTKIKDVPMEDRHLLYTALVVDLFPSEVVLLDEVTSALRKDKCDILFAYLNRIKHDRAVVLITHRIKEVLEFCDVVTVFRNGRRIVTDDVRNLNVATLSNLIVGENVEIPEFEKSVYCDYGASPPVILETKSATAHPFFKDVSFKLHEREILGITGLVESGVTQLLRSVAGVEPLESGELFLKGRPVANLTPEKALALGVAYGTNDRLNEGTMPDLSVMNNINVCVWPRLVGPPFGFIQRSREQANYDNAVDSFNLKCHSPNTGVTTLSGGNQQKCILTRLISTNSSVYVFDEPTKGIDVGAVYEILRYLRLRIVSENCGIIVNLSSIEELMLVCDRVITVVDGRVRGEFRRADFSEDAIFRSVQGVG